MNCFLRYIGVVDTQDQLHHVPFERGLNIITGASSTGKSAILEIFDFCLGASENTIPVGRITERAKIYLIALEFPSHLLVAARTSSDGGCYLTEWPGTHQALLEALQATPERFTEERHQYPEPRFKKELGRYFNITLKNVDEEAWRLNVPGRNPRHPQSAHLQASCSSTKIWSQTSMRFFIGLMRRKSVSKPSRISKF